MSELADDSILSADELANITSLTDPAELLAQVREVQVPEASAWPAPGWWVLLGCLLVCGLFWALKKQQEKRKNLNAWRVELKGEIVGLSKKIPSAEPEQQLQVLKDASVLLRRAAMHVQGRENVAGLTGNAWIQSLQSLNHSEPLPEELQTLLISGAYAPAPIKELTQDKLQQLLGWITSFVDNFPDGHSTTRYSGEQEGQR